MTTDYQNPFAPRVEELAGDLAHLNERFQAALTSSQPGQPTALESIPELLAKVQGIVGLRDEAAQKRQALDDFASTCEQDAMYVQTINELLQLLSGCKELIVRINAARNRVGDERGILIRRASVERAHMFKLGIPQETVNAVYSAFHVDGL